MTTVSEALEEPVQYNLRIYSYISIGLATFLGGPVAAAYLLSKNFRAFNKPDGIIVAWFVAVMFEIGVFIAFFAIPGVDDIWFILPVTYTAVALLLTKKFQGRQMAEYYAEGGDAFAYSKGLGMGLLILAITVAALVIGIIAILALSGVSC